MAIPLCPYFGKCGGCSAQHIDYALQAENKGKWLAKAIDIDEKDVKVFTGREYGYRNRMDFIFHSRGLGLREKGRWHSIIDVGRCEISDDKINSLLNETREFFKDCDHFDIRKKTGTFRYAVIRTADNDSSISFVLNEDSARTGEAIERVKEFADKTSAKNIIITYVPKDTDISISENFFVVKGKDMLEEHYLGKKFLYSVQGFFQNNHLMAERMQTYVNEVLEKHDRKYTYLLDLYAGVGTFGIINSGLFKQVTMIESVKQCIDAAEINIKENNVANAKAIVMDAKNLRKMTLSTPLFVITDPPRSGMDPKTILHLNDIKPKVMIYISCNIEQLAKDLPKFKNYEIKSAALFDLFPQTPHCEGVVELVLKK